MTKLLKGVTLVIITTVVAPVYAGAIAMAGVAFVASISGLLLL